MPRLVHTLPQIRHHTPSNRASIRIDGKECWLGTYGSPESLREYDRIISEWLANGRKLPVPSPKVADIKSDTSSSRSVTNGQTVSSLPVGKITITTLIAEFTKWADRHYRHPSGEPTREAENFEHVTKPLRKMFGTLPVESFGPTRFLALRDSLIKKKLARRTISRMIGRVRMVFKWGVSRALVPVEVLQRLQTVEPLQPGRGGKATSDSRGSVPWETIEKTLPFLPRLLQAFITVAYHTGCRVGELSELNTGQIDKSQEIWVADLSQHKNAHRGKSRKIFFRPRAQEALSPWLLEKQPDAIIFSPLRIDERQTKRRGKKLPRKNYSRCGLSQSLKRAIARGAIEPKWTLAMLRHSAAVRVTDEYDLEVARQLLGHGSAATTSLYSRDSNSAARKAAKRFG